MFAGMATRTINARSKQVPIRIPHALHADAKAAADKAGLSLAGWVLVACAAYLARPGDGLLPLRTAPRPPPSPPPATVAVKPRKRTPPTTQVKPMSKADQLRILREGRM